MIDSVNIYAFCPCLRSQPPLKVCDSKKSSPACFLGQLGQELDSESPAAWLYGQLTSALIGSNFICQPDGSQRGLSNQLYQLHPAWEYERRIIFLPLVRQEKEGLGEQRHAWEVWIPGGLLRLFHRSLLTPATSIGVRRAQGVHTRRQGSGSKPRGPNRSYSPGKSWREKGNVNHVVFVCSSVFV